MVELKLPEIIYMCYWHAALKQEVMKVAWESLWSQEV